MTSIFANTDGPRDAVSHEIANTTLHPSEITRQQALQAIFRAHCYIDRHLHITYIHGKAQTPLGEFVVDVLHQQVCNKYRGNQNDGTITLVYRQRHRWGQVYLLTPMDCATLLQVKSIILHGLPSIITRQRASVDSELLCRPRNVGYYHIFER